jgi:peptidoglycan/LPS O-acetylase OafA/YrhL
MPAGQLSMSPSNLLPNQNRDCRPSAPSRIDELDALRGVLALGIVLFHLYPNSLFWFWSFVDGFFVLSGFVITRLLLCNPTNSSTLLNFYARRAIRIWPVYFVTMAVAVCFNSLYALKNEIPLSTIKGIPQSLVFLQYIQFYWRPYSEYFQYDYIRWFGHSWSLAVEEQFYWLWPVALFLFSKRRTALIACCLFLIAIGIYSRASGLLIFLFATRADGLALGAMLALGECQLQERKDLLKGAKPLLVVGCITIASPFLFVAMRSYILPNYRSATVLNLHFQDTTWLVLQFAVLFAALVACIRLMQGMPALRVLRSKPLIWFGSRSYAIYMFHQPVQGLMERLAERHSWPHSVNALLTVALTLALAHLSFAYIESRVVRFRRRFPLNVPSAE